MTVGTTTRSVRTIKQSVRGINTKVRTMKQSPKTKMKKVATAASASARKNVLSSYRLLSINGILNTRGVITKEGNDMVSIKLSRTIIKKLKDIYLMSQKHKSEYVGIINVTRSGKIVKFNSPTKHTNWNPTAVRPPPGTENNLVVYHTHPVPVGMGVPYSSVTIPSQDDFTYYINNYPKVQANIILERHGYYIIDLLESNLSSMPDPARVFNKFIFLLRNKGLANYEVSPYANKMGFYAVSISSWKNMMKYVNEVLSHMFKVSIKYYTYSELPEITLKNPDTVRPQP